MKWKHFPHYWPFVWGIHWSLVNSPDNGQWREALMFSLICVWTNGWVNYNGTSNTGGHGISSYVIDPFLTVHHQMICRIWCIMPTLPKLRSRLKIKKSHLALATSQINVPALHSTQGLPVRSWNGQPVSSILLQGEGWWGDQRVGHIIGTVLTHTPLTLLEPHSILMKMYWSTC